MEKMSAKDKNPTKITVETKSQEHLETDGTVEDKECPICRQAFVLPIKLTCQHKFCYLCAKGAVTRSRSCPFCRSPVSLTYFDDTEALNTNLEKKENEVPSTIWYYQARRGGWWSYDRRSSQELEIRWKKNAKDRFEMVIAGFLYTIDFDEMKQFRKDNTNSFREMKRDPTHQVELRGYAGIGKKVYEKLPTKSEDSDKDVLADHLDTLTLDSQPKTRPDV